jgi:hypothetical protein
LALKHFIGMTAVAVAIVLSACSSAPPPETKAAADAKEEATKPPEPVAARNAYFALYKEARAWAPDLLALTVKSEELPGVKNEGGKAGAWTVVFVSGSKKEARTFTWAVAKGGNLVKGVNVSDKQTWTGATTAGKAFVNGEFLVDSDAAYETAKAKAADWLKTHPNMPVTFALGSTARFPAPVWYILWGTNKDGYAVYVNAATGAIVTR